MPWRVPAARRELARNVEDVLARRTRALSLDARASAECAPVVACLLAKELGRDDRWIKEQVSAFQTLAENVVNGVKTIMVNEPLRAGRARRIAASAMLRRVLGRRPLLPGTRHG